MSASRYTLVLHDPDDDTVETPIAELSLASGQLEVLSAEPGCLGFVNTLLDEVEAQDGVALRASGAAATSLVATHVPRSDIGFLDALRTVWGRRYGLELRSPEDLRPELLEG